jgi:hypothetical protein
MSADRYFVLGQVAGSMHRRYGVLAPDGRTVVSVQASRPDGVEVEHPGRALRWNVQPWYGGEVRAAWFNNCPPAAGSFPPKIKDADAKRARGFLAGWGKSRAQKDVDA